LKYLVLIPDGAGDYPLKELNNKTPLKVADTPNMDRLAHEGFVGKAKSIPEEMPPGSDVAILSILGYDPRKYYTGRGPLEAAAMGIVLREDEVAFRCNLVTLQDEVLEDYSAGHITNQEAKELIECLNENLKDERVIFYQGVSYRHLLVIKGDFSDIQTTPPHDIIGKNYREYLPRGRNCKLLNELFESAHRILVEHPINQKRLKNSKNPANSIWLWGQGKAPNLKEFRKIFGISGSVVSAVDLIKGIAVYVGLSVIEVPGATGYLDTNYEGKAEYAIESLKENDFVLVHLEAPDEASHNGDLSAKIQAIENFDSRLLRNIIRGIEAFDRYRILILPDHFTPIKVRTHVPEIVPFVIWGSGVPSNSDVSSFSEEILNLEGNVIPAYNLIDFMIKL
jgi:2,3-bisphosphoglycerate-independent phosphoglycerate mutase